MGWYLDMPADKGVLRFQTAGRDPEANAAVTTPAGTIHEDAWQHIAVVARRGKNDIRIYVNGSLVGRAATGFAQFDETKADLQIGHIPGSGDFQGDLADVRLYRRPLEEAEIQGLIQPGKQLVKAVAEKPQDVTLKLGEQQFIGKMQPAFLVVRLEAGALAFSAKYAGVRDLQRIVLTPLGRENEAAERFLAFEKRTPAAGRASWIAPGLRQHLCAGGPGADGGE